MENSKIFLSILAILLIVIIFAEVFRKKRKEGFRKCICSAEQAGRESVCQDTEVVDRLYQDNFLTESTNLKSKGWSTTSPGDVNWPLSEGCPWPDNTKNSKQWQAWDFTDFGS